MHMKKTLLLLFSVALSLTTAPANPARTPPGLQEKVSLRLTLLHNNDSESQLINAGGSLTEFAATNAAFV